MSGARGASRRRRRASEAELALWRAATRDALPLHARAAPSPEPQPAPTPPRPAAPKPVLAFAPSPRPREEPAVRFYPAPPDLDALSARTPGLDRGTAQALRKGRRAPDARLDLHGMTLDQAHGALATFVQDQRARGARCVLVITGKGGGGASARGTGALRRDVPRWLRQPPLAGMVTGVFEAHARHGGEGALYVYLRKARGR